MAEDIKKLREQIDRIDAKILKLYEERMDVARKIGQYKIDNDLPIYDAAREDEKLEKIFEAVGNEDYADGAAQLFITLMQVSREIQEEMSGMEDDFDWSGEPVEINLESLGGFGSDAK
ncbi:MAG: chorismate mutase [Lachnospiraceae bacterium]|nr:chorismate mutase [Lachnospiraceae bacterium]